MGQAISKKDWDAFLADDGFWENYIYDEALFEVDGEEVEDIDPELPDTTLIKIKGGVVTDQDKPESHKSLAGFYRKWLKRQNTRHQVIAVPSSVSDRELRDHLKAIGVTLR